jgi:glutathione S-transferase
MPRDAAGRLQALRVIGLALAACEKSVQIVYEREQRPAEKLHQPWVDRVRGQMLEAYAALEAEFARHPRDCTGAGIDQAGVSTAAAWQFTRQLLPELLPAANCPLLREFSSKAEALAEFRAVPHGSGTYRHAG